MPLSDIPDDERDAYQSSRLARATNSGGALDAFSSGAMDDVVSGGRQVRYMQQPTGELVGIAPPSGAPAFIQRPGSSVIEDPSTGEPYTPDPTSPNGYTGAYDNANQTVTRTGDVVAKVPGYGTRVLGRDPVKDAQAQDKADAAALADQYRAEGRPFYVSKVDGKPRPKDAPGVWEAKQAAAADKADEKARVLPIAQDLKANRALLADPDLGVGKITDKQREKMQKEIEGNNSVLNGLAASSKKIMGKAAFEYAATPDELAAAAQSPQGASLAARNQELQQKMAAADRASQKKHAIKSTLADLQLQKDNPEEYAKRQLARVQQAPSSEIPGIIDELSASAKQKAASAQQSAQALQQQQNQFHADIADIDTQQQAQSVHGINASQMQKFAVAREGVQQRQQDWQTQNKGLIQGVNTQAQMANQDATLATAAAQIHDQKRATERMQVIDQMSRDPDTADIAKQMLDLDQQHQQRLAKWKDTYPNPAYPEAAAGYDAIDKEFQQRNDDLAKKYQDIIAKKPKEVEESKLPPPEGVAASFFRPIGAHLLPALGAAAGGVIGGAAAGAAGLTGGPLAAPAAIAGDLAGGGIGQSIVQGAQNWAIGPANVASEAAHEEANAQAHPVVAGFGRMLAELPSVFGGGIYKEAKLADEAGKAILTDTGKQAMKPLTRGQNVINEATSFGRMGAGGATSDVANNAPDVQGKTNTEKAAYILDSIAKNALAGASMGGLHHVTTMEEALKPVAETFLSGVLKKPATDAAVMTVTNNMYDYVAHGKPFDPVKIAKEFGSDAPAFMVLAWLGHASGMGKGGSSSDLGAPLSEPAKDASGKLLPDHLSEENQAAASKAIEDWQPDVATLPKQFQDTMEKDGTTTPSPYIAKNAAETILKIARGADPSEMDSESDLKHVGLKRNDSGKIVQDKDFGAPFVEMMPDAKGDPQPVITDAGMSFLKTDDQILPVTNAIGLAPSDRRKQINGTLPKDEKTTSRTTGLDASQGKSPADKSGANKPSSEGGRDNRTVGKGKKGGSKSDGEGVEEKSSQPAKIDSSGPVTASKEAPPEPAATTNEPQTRPALGHAPPDQRRVIGKGNKGPGANAEFAHPRDTDAFAYQAKHKIAQGNNVSESTRTAALGDAASMLKRVADHTGLDAATLRPILRAYNEHVRELGKATEPGEAFHAPTIKEFIDSHPYEGKRVSIDGKNGTIGKQGEFKNGEKLEQTIVTMDDGKTRAIDASKLKAPVEEVKETPLHEAYREAVKTAPDLDNRGRDAGNRVASALQKWTPVFEKAGFKITLGEMTGSGIGYEPKTKSVKIDPVAFSADLAKSGDASAMDKRLAAIMREELLHGLIRNHIGADMPVKWWKEFGKTDAGKAIQTASIEAYDASFKLRGEEIPDRGDPNRADEFARQLFQKKFWDESGITELAGKDPEVKSALHNIITALIDALNSIRKAAPKAVLDEIDAAEKMLRGKLEELGELEKAPEPEKTDVQASSEAQASEGIPEPPNALQAPENTPIDDAVQRINDFHKDEEEPGNWPDDLYNKFDEIHDHLQSDYTEPLPFYPADIRAKTDRIAELDAKMDKDSESDSYDAWSNERDKLDDEVKAWADSKGRFAASEGSKAAIQSMLPEVRRRVESAKQQIEATGRFKWNAKRKEFDDVSDEMQVRYAGANVDPESPISRVSKFLTEFPDDIYGPITFIDPHGERVHFSDVITDLQDSASHGDIKAIREYADWLRGLHPSALEADTTIHDFADDLTYLTNGDPRSNVVEPANDSPEEKRKALADSYAGPNSRDEMSTDEYVDYQGKKEDILGSVKLPEGWEISDHTTPSSKWGTAYLYLHNPDGDLLKLRIGDHQASRERSSENDASFRVPKDASLSDWANAVSRVEKWARGGSDVVEPLNSTPEEITRAAKINETAHADAEDLRATMDKFLGPDRNVQQFDPHKINLNPEDEARAMQHAKDGGDDWASKVDITNPVGLFRRPDGELQAYDGAHRTIAARMRGEMVHGRVAGEGVLHSSENPDTPLSPDFPRKEIWDESKAHAKDHPEMFGTGKPGEGRDTDASKALGFINWYHRQDADRMDVNEATARAREIMKDPLQQRRLIDVINETAEKGGVLPPAETFAWMALRDPLYQKAVAMNSRNLLNIHDNTSLAFAQTGTEWARSGKARQDPLMTPAQRIRNVVRDVARVPTHRALIRKIQALPTESAKQRKIKGITRKLADALTATKTDSETIRSLQRELATARREASQMDALARYSVETGKRIDSVMNKLGFNEYDVQLDNTDRVAAMKSEPVKQAMSGMSAQDQRIAEMLMQGNSHRDVAKKTGRNAEYIGALHEDFRNKLEAQLRTFLGHKGKTLRDMIDEGHAAMVERLGGSKNVKGDLGDPQVTQAMSKANQALIQKALSWLMPTAKMVNSGKLKKVGVIVGSKGDKVTLHVPYDPENQAQAMRLARELSSAQSTKFDKVQEAWIMGILSGPVTQFANVAGNVVSTSWHYGYQRPVEALANLIMRNPDGVQWGEFKHLRNGVMPGLREAFSNAMQAYSTETDVVAPRYLNEPLTISAKDGVIDKMGGSKGAIGGVPGRTIRIPGRLLMAMDAFFKTAIARMEVGALAYREGAKQGLSGTALENHIHNETTTYGSDSWKRAVSEAEMLTFQNASWLSKAGEAMVRGKGAEYFTKQAQKLRAEGRHVEASEADAHAAKLDAVSKGLSFLFPFVRTPSNIMLMGVRKSPIGSLGVMARIASGLYKKAADGTPFFESYPQATLAKHLVEQTAAWGAMGLLWGMTEGDDDDSKKTVLLVGGKAYDPAKRAELDYRKRTYGGDYGLIIRDNQGNEIFRVAWGRYEPIATALGLLVDGIRSIKDMQKAKSVGGIKGADPADAVTAMASGFMAQIEQKSYLQGIADLSKTMQDIKSGKVTGGEIGKRAGNSILMSLVPNIIRQPIRNWDDTVRDSRNKSESWYPAWPVAQGAEPMMDVFGREIGKDGPAAARLLMPFPNAPADAVPADEVIRAYIRNNPDEKDSHYFAPVDKADYYVLQGKTKIPVTLPKQKAFLEQRVGQLFLQKSNAIVSQIPAPLRDNPPKEYVEQLHKAKAEAWRTARTQLGQRGILDALASR